MSKATIIGKKDYWLSSWGVDHESISYGDNGEAKGPFYIREFYDTFFNNIEEKRTKRNAIFLLILTGLFVIFAMAIPAFYATLQLNINLIFQILSGTAAFIVGGLATLFALVRIINSDKVKFLRKFLEDREMSDQYHEVNCSFEQAKDIVDELKRLKLDDNKKEYMKIVRKIIAPKLEEAAEYHRSETERRKNNELERLERNSVNPYLNNELYVKKVDSLSKEIEAFKQYNSQKFTERLDKIEEKLNSVQVENKDNFSKSAVRNIRDELLEVTESFNEIKNSGIELTQLQYEEYERLLENCGKILEKIEENNLEKASDGAKVSNMFLEDKYNIKS